MEKVTKTEICPVCGKSWLHHKLDEWRKHFTTKAMKESGGDFFGHAGGGYKKSN